jgi:hypothetical protein
VLGSNTIVGNSAVLAGGGLHVNESSHMAVSSTILWQNEAPEGAEIWIGDRYGASDVTIDYSDVRGGEALVHVERGSSLDWGAGMLDADPMFRDTQGDDLRLSRDSPCVDRGNPAERPCLETDVAASARLLDGRLEGAMRIDMGAHEFGNVNLRIAGSPKPGETLTFTTSGTAGLIVFVLVGTEAGAACADPYGSLLFEVAKPWWAFFWGGIPASGSYDVPVTIPPDVPAPRTYVLQQVAVQLGGGAGNTSNAVALLIEP